MSAFSGLGLTLAATFSLVALGTLQGCAGTPESGGQIAERDEGVMVTGSRIPRRDKGGPTSAVTVIESGDMNGGLRAAGAGSQNKRAAGAGL